LEQFFDPGTEMLVAHDGEQVAEHLRQLDGPTAHAIGQAAYRRVLAQHTYAHRAAQLEAVLQGREASQAAELAS
jgi:spore maturation protein CgeB